MPALVRVCTLCTFTLVRASVVAVHLQACTLRRHVACDVNYGEPGNSIKVLRRCTRASFAIRSGDDLCVWGALPRKQRLSVCPLSPAPLSADNATGGVGSVGAEQKSSGVAFCTTPVTGERSRRPACVKDELVAPCACDSAGTISERYGNGFAHSMKYTISHTNIKGLVFVQYSWWE